MRSAPQERKIGSHGKFEIAGHVRHTFRAGTSAGSRVRDRDRGRRETARSEGPFCPRPGNNRALALRHVRSTRRFRCALERAAADTVTSQFLGCLEAALGRFPFRLMLSVQDLFDRPGRYETALDFAYQCGVPLKTVYRWFEDGRIGTPKKLIVAAKVLRAYCYLRNHRCSTVLVSRNVGYGSPRRLTKHVYSIFGCSPRWLATQSSTTELFMGLFDWMYKPSGLSKRCARTTPVNCRRVLG